MGRKCLNLRGAYGRRAKLEDWLQGKDFQIIDGPYCSIRDVGAIKARGYTHIMLYSIMPEEAIEVAL